MNCDEAAELLGAHALAALPDEEEAALRAHLVGCDKHSAVLADLRAAARQLPALAEPMDAPPSLRARVLDAISSDAAASRAGTPRPIGAASSHARVAKGADSRRASMYRWGALAAALVVALGGLLAWNLVLMNRDSGVDQFATRATSIVTLKKTSGDATGAVVYFDHEKKAFVILDNLPPLDSEKNVYEMWAMNGGRAERIGLMQSAGTQTKVVVPFDATTSQIIGITIEPAGGSAQPTTAPIITTGCIAATNCRT